MKGGELIKRKRIEYGLSQQEVADACGVSKSTVCKWQTGDISNMRRDRIAALSKILHVSPLQIVNSESTFMITMSKTQEVMLQCYRDLTEQQKLVVLQLIQSMLPKK